MADSRAAFRNLKQDAEVPVLILGGGVNGAGLFRELALQGVECLLVDKADFVAGASSKSSRMIHGGLRYLESREFKLVRESLLERNRLLDNAPHYVTPLKTTIPLFSWLGGALHSVLIFLGCDVRPGGRGALLVKLGLSFYDFVTRKNRRTPRHFLTGRAKSLRELPGLNPHIKATATYWDAQISEAERLCIEMLQDACSANPACRALNYVRPEKVEGGAVVLRDEVTGETATVRPRIVVNATGAWVDLANAALGLATHFMGGTKGSHLVVDCPELHKTLGDRMVYYEHKDGRVCIAFTFMGKVLMGSTDLRVDDPDAAHCEEDEIAYMLTTLRGVFPGIEIRREQIAYVFCGVRPLPASGKGVTAIISRGHSIRVVEPEGERPFPVFCLIGGKWTTFRAFAEQVADQILPRLGVERRCSTHDLPIGGGGNFPADGHAKEQWISRLAEESGASRERVAALLARYGTVAEAYLAKADARAESPLKSLPDYTVGEIERIAATEQVVHLADLLCRRSTIAIRGLATAPVLGELADIVGSVLGWAPPRRQAEVALALGEMAVPKLPPAR
ncbi:MAG TPA: glycerol-3-phosphate dehydrogenase/oxidase [Planctomycetota bacterium]|nr:glycerol-3-phosphate dehydrogenase/oxidase [Planctomycetota bacterium]